MSWFAFYLSVGVLVATVALADDFEDWGSALWLGLWWPVYAAVVALGLALLVGTAITAALITVTVAADRARRLLGGSE
jgi:hypothetical protein